MHLKFLLKINKCIFKLVAAILWLGNISFEVIDLENHVQVVTDEGSRTAATLMGCNVFHFFLLEHSTLQKLPNYSNLIQNFLTRKKKDKP
ncbi:hypothetical protein L1887_01089 [Cichorium endivia]|nr:hypothetical protein L1887_01089 [Cichorium endivia]